MRCMVDSLARNVEVASTMRTGHRGCGATDAATSGRDSQWADKLGNTGDFVNTPSGPVRGNGNCVRGERARGRDLDRRPSHPSHGSVPSHPTYGPTFTFTV